MNRFLPVTPDLGKKPASGKVWLRACFASSGSREEMEDGSDHSARTRRKGEEQEEEELELELELDEPTWREYESPAFWLLGLVVVIGRR